MVLLAALVATGANALSAVVYVTRKIETSSCQEKLVESGIYRLGESALKQFARDMQASPEVKDNVLWDILIQAEGRTLSYTYRFKKGVFDMGAFHAFLGGYEKHLFEGRCSNTYLTLIKTIETHTFYKSEGQRLTSFSIDRASCPQW